MADQNFSPMHHYGMSGAGGYNPRVQFDSNVPAGVDPDALWRKQNSQRQRRTGATPAERAGAVPGYTPGYGRSAAGNTTGTGSDVFTPRLAGLMQPRMTPAPVPPPQVFPDNPAATAAAAEAAKANGAPSVLPNSAKPSPSPAYVPPVNNMHGEITNGTGGYGATQQVQVRPYDASKLALTGNKAIDDANQRSAFASNLDWAQNPTQPVPSPGGLPPSLPATPHPDTPAPPIQQASGVGATVRTATGLPPGQAANATFVPGQNTPANLAKRTRPPVDPYS